MMEQLVKVFSASAPSVFLNYGGHTVTYREYLETSAALGKKFFGLKERPTVCVISKNTRLYFYCFMAVLLYGGRAVPIDAEKTAENIAEIIETVNPDYIVSDGPVEGREALHIDVDALTWDGSFPECLDMLSRVDSEREYLVTFTSGTTTEPKGVVHCFGNLLRSARALGSLFGFNQDSVFYHNFPVSYMTGILNQFIVPMAFGAQVAAGERFGVRQALHFWRQPIAYCANVFWMSPTILRLLLSLDRDGKGREYCSAKNIIVLVATAPLPVSLRKSFEAAYRVPLYESYGLTETLFNATNHPGRPVRDGCAGYVLPGVQTEIAPDEELILRCDWMFLRYFHEERTFGERNTFETGDFAKIEDIGLYIIGRKKDLIIKGGMNVSPGRIEAELDRFMEAEEFAVIGLPDPILGEKTVLTYAAAVPMNKDAEKAVNQRLIARFGRDYTIDAFIRVSAIPKNANGKVDKRSLRDSLMNL